MRRKLDLKQVEQRRSGAGANSKITSASPPGQGRGRKYQDAGPAYTFRCVFAHTYIGYIRYIYLYVYE